MALGRITARQGNQMGLATIIQLPVPIGLGMVVQHTVQSLLSVPPFGAQHRARRGVQRRRHLARAPSFVSLEQDPRPSDLSISSSFDPVNRKMTKVIDPVFHRL